MKIHGEKPTDWSDNPAFEYELRFVDEPTDAQCEALAHAWAAHCSAKTPTRAGVAKFSRAFAYLTAIPRRPGKARELFRHVASFIRSVHSDVAPLHEAVLLDALEDYALDPGPSYPGSQRAVDDGYPAPAPREAFQRVVRELARQEKNERFARWTAEPPAGQLGLRVIDTPDVAGEPEVPETLRAMFPAPAGQPGAMTWGGSSSRPRRVPVEYAHDRSDFDFIVGGETTTLKLPEGLLTRGGAAVDPKSRRIVLEAKQDRRGVLLEVQPDNGELRPLWSTESGEQDFGHLDIAWLTDDHLAVATDQRLVVLHAPADQPATVAYTRRGKRYVVACAGGRLLYETNAGLYAWNGKKLVAVTKWKVDYLYFHHETDDTITLRHGQPKRPGPDDTYFEITNLPAVLAAHVPTSPSPKKKKKKKKVTKAKAKSTASRWVPVETPRPTPEADAPDHPSRGDWTHPDNPIDGLNRWGPETNPTLVRAAAAEVWAALALEGVTLYANGTPHRVETYRPKRLAISPGGTRAYALQSNLAVICAITTDSDEAERVVWSDEAKIGDIGDFAPVGEDQLVVVGKKAAVWLQRDAGAWTELARSTAIKGGRRVVAVDEHIAILASGSKPLLVVTRNGPDLKKLAADGEGADDLFVRDGALHALRLDGAVVRYDG